MNQEWKDKWVAALRSDKYTQTRGCLHDSRGMCCLGVACDVYDPTKWVGAKSETRGVGYSYLNEDNYPPRSIVKAFGLETHNPIMATDRDGVIALASINDSGEFSFDQIADLIQALL